MSNDQTYTQKMRFNHPQVTTSMLVYIFIECYFAFLSTSSKMIDKIQKACAHTFMHESLKKSYHSFVTRFDNDLSILRTSLFISFLSQWCVESSRAYCQALAQRENHNVYKLKNKWMMALTKKFTFWLLPNLQLLTFIKISLSLSFI